MNFHADLQVFRYGHDPSSVMRGAFAYVYVCGLRPRKSKVAEIRVFRIYGHIKGGVIDTRMLCWNSQVNLTKMDPFWEKFQITNFGITIRGV